MEMPKFNRSEKPQELEDIKAEAEGDAEEASKKAKDLVVDPSSGLITERDNLRNPNA